MSPVYSHAFQLWRPVLPRHRRVSSLLHLALFSSPRVFVALLCAVAVCTLVGAQVVVPPHISAQDLELMEADYVAERPFTPRTRDLSPHDYQHFLDGLSEYINAREELPFENIGLGYNANLDLVAAWDHVLAHFGFEKPPLPSGQGFAHENLGSVLEFAEAFQHSFENGIALERMVTNTFACNTLVNYVKTHAESVKIIGGNAANMMLTFKREGAKLLPGFTPGPELSALFEKFKIVFPKQLTNDDLYHIILEFKQGDVWGDLVAPRANRFIFHCDRVNSRLPNLEVFHATMELDQPMDLIVLAGLHLLERESEEYYTERLYKDKLRTKIPKAIPVHLELASVGNPDFMRFLFTEVVIYVNSLGFNEQELLSLYAAAFPRDPELPSYRERMKDPSVDMCLTMMKKLLYEIVRLNPDLTMRHRVGRMHLHTLKFHVVAETAYGGWEKGDSSVAAGAFISSLRSCALRDPQDPELSQKFDLPLLRNETLWGYNMDSFMSVAPVHQLWWMSLPVRPLINYWIAPVMVCRNPVGTVGLGDAISSMGLMYHRFDYNKNAMKPPNHQHLF